MPFRFESLKIWHMAREYGKQIYQVTATFPRKEDYGLTSQLNRAVNSISLNIAEGSAKKTDKHFDLYLDNAIGSVFKLYPVYIARSMKHILAGNNLRTCQQGETLAKSINAFRHTLKP